MKYFNFLFTSIIFKKLLRLSCFFFPGEPRRVFHHLSWVFLNFLSWVFHCLSWVVPRFLGITFTLIGVFADFLSHTLFLCCCSASATALRELLLPSSVFLPYTPSSHLSQYHECYRTERVIFLLRCFLPYTPSRHLPHLVQAPAIPIRSNGIHIGCKLCHYTLSTTIYCTNLLLRVSWELAVLPWSCRASQLWFKTQTRPICLFE